MTNRSSIKDAIITLIKTEMDGSRGTVYYTDIDDAVTGQNLYVQDVQSFPTISVALGPETPEYQPGGFRWIFLTLYVRCYVKSEDEAEERLEQLIEDVKTFVDRNEDITYNVLKPGGNPSNPNDLQSHTATQMTVQEITTDEGVLRPFGIGEIRLQVRYQDRNSRFTR